MDAFLKMDIFFFVTTLAVVVLAALATVMLIRLNRILKNAEYVSEQIAAESDAVRLDLAEMRGDIRRGKGRIKSLLGFIDKTAKRVNDD